MSIIILALMIATVLVLIAGVILMGKGGELNKKYSNALMVARVSLQGAVILLLFIMYLVYRK